MEEALEAYAAKLGIGESVKREAAESDRGALRHAVTPPSMQGSSTPIPWKGRPLQLAPEEGARAARGPVSRNRPDPRKRGWARMDRRPERGEVWRR
jgi:hypothetical protein